MNTITKLATSSITNTKLAVATLIALAAGGAALATVPLNNQTKLPDLVISSVTLKNNNGLLTGNVIIKNIGRGPAKISSSSIGYNEPYYIEIYSIKSNGTSQTNKITVSEGWISGGTPGQQLLPQNTISLPISLIVSANTVQLKLVVDQTGMSKTPEFFKESNETNNSTIVRVPVSTVLQDKPDLIIDSINLSNKSGSLNGTAIIKNIGTGPAIISTSSVGYNEPYYIEIFSVKSSGALVSEGWATGGTPGQQLAPNATISLPIGLMVSTNTVQLKLVVDQTGMKLEVNQAGMLQSPEFFKESNETNNSKVVNLQW